MLKATKFQFQIILFGETSITEAMENNLYKGGCWDALLCSTGNEVYLDFIRIGLHWNSTLQTALADVKRAGYTPKLRET